MYTYTYVYICVYIIYIYMYIYVYICIYIHTHATGQKDIEDLLGLAAGHVFQGIFFKANFQRPELWIVKKKTQILYENKF